MQIKERNKTAWNTWRNKRIAMGWKIVTAFVPPEVAVEMRAIADRSRKLRSYEKAIGQGKQFADGYLERISK